jgi:hypothetical protein
MSYPAYLQAAGLVNDHVVERFRYRKIVREGAYADGLIQQAGGPLAGRNLLYEGERYQ